MFERFKIRFIWNYLFIYSNIGFHFAPVDRRRIWPATEWYFTFSCIHSVPSPLAARSKAWVYGRSLAGIAGSNSGGGHGFLSLGRVVCCQVGVSVTGWSLVQRSPTKCKTECDRGTSQRRPKSSRIVLPWAPPKIISGSLTTPCQQ